MVERDLSQARVQLLQDKYNIIQSIRGNSRVRTRLGDIIQSTYRVLPYQPTSQHDRVFHYMCQNYNLSLTQQLMASRGSNEDLSNINKQMMSWMMNSWDPLSLCEDIAIWRANVLTELSRRLSSETSPRPITPSFCYILLSRTARYQGMYNTAQEYLNQLPSESSSVLESIDKWKERAYIQLDMDNCDGTIFNELERFQLDALRDNQKSSIYFMKGRYYQKSHNVEEAINHYMRAVHMESKNNKVWEAWSSITYTRWCERNEINDARQCLTCCVNCLVSNYEVYKVMPRLLHIISSTLDNTAFSQVITALIKPIPYTTWAPFLPCILSQPSDSQLLVFREVLKEFIQKMAHRIFYPLHNLCLALGVIQDGPYARNTVTLAGTMGTMVSE